MKGIIKDGFAEEGLTIEVNQAEADMAGVVVAWDVYKDGIRLNAHTIVSSSPYDWLDAFKDGLRYASSQTSLLTAKLTKEG